MIKSHFRTALWCIT